MRKSRQLENELTSRKDILRAYIIARQRDELLDSEILSLAFQEYPWANLALITEVMDEVAEESS